MKNIERELHIEASPEIVYEVLSTPEHLTKWWPDEASVAAPGVEGSISFGDLTQPFTVTEAVPPHRFSFTWAEGSQVTFTLTPSGTGTLVRFVESGFPDEASRTSHVDGWNHFLPRLVEYAPSPVHA